MTSNREQQKSSEQSTSGKSVEIKTSSLPEPTFGWNSYAEILNGRFAMVGIIVLLTIEFVTHQDIFTWLGLR